MESRLKSYFNRQNHEENTVIYNPRDVSMIKRSVRDEYYPKPVKEDLGVPVIDGVVVDTKATEKFEPYYENESHEQPDHTESTP
jgi:hypothetical protein